MSVEKIRKLKRAQPFRPFMLVLKEGKQVLLSRPESFAISPNGKSIMVSARNIGPMLPLSEIVSVRTLQRRAARPGLSVSRGSRTVGAVNVDEIRELYSAAPFEPFELVLTNGARLLVDHPEFLAFSRDFRTLYVSKNNAGTQRVDVKMIVALNEMANGARSRKRKR